MMGREKNNDCTLEERVKAYDYRAMAYKYGQPGALEKVCKEVIELKRELKLLGLVLEMVDEYPYL